LAVTTSNDPLRARQALALDQLGRDAGEPGVDAGEVERLGIDVGHHDLRIRTGARGDQRADPGPRTDIDDPRPLAAAAAAKLARDQVGEAVAVGPEEHRVVSTVG
jgi:hypothetical protein